jgi:hypothetical protein
VAQKGGMWFDPLVRKKKAQDNFLIAAPHTWFAACLQNLNENGNLRTRDGKKVCVGVGGGTCIVEDHGYYQGDGRSSSKNGIENVCSSNQDQ